MGNPFVRTVSPPTPQADVASTLASLPNLPRDQATVPTPSPPAPGGVEELPVDPGRLSLGPEIARGGMGIVVLGYDPVLGRNLAIKVLHPQHQEHPALVQRFLEEAQIGGQLQHPNIVPIHELGRLADGRPFFSMKLVKGQTLAELLAGRLSPAHDLAHYLQVFLQVCQALAYAHSRQVIHRDLKPANVMVGAFGEIQVMDWGLAKVLSAGSAPPLPESAVQTVRSAAPALHSQPGTMIGTLAYMPPEQARGEVERIDARSDVFGLGAILCEILTGRPPYTGRGTDEVRYQALDADLAGARQRLREAGADPELRRLTLACLDRDPARRPSHAGEVARAVEAYLAGVQDRLRQAERERTAAEARADEAQAKARAERRARRSTLGLLVACVVLVLLTLGGSWWVQRQKSARRAATESEVSAALAEANSLADQARGLHDRPGQWRATLAAALSAVKHAEGLLHRGEAGDDWTRRVAALRAEVEGAERDRALVAEVDRIRLAEAEVHDGNFAYDRAAREYAAAFRGYGVDVFTLAPSEAADLLKSRAVCEPLLAALRDWARLTSDPAERGRLDAVLEACEPNPSSFTVRWRTALAGKDHVELLRLADEAELDSLPAAEFLNLALDLEKANLRPKAEWLLRQGHQRFPGDFWINHRLGYLLMKASPPRRDEALPFFQSALALRDHSAAAQHNLGFVLYELGRVDEAIPRYRRALHLDPRYTNALIHLGNALYTKGRLAEAADCYRAALELDPMSALAHNNLGNIYHDQERLDEAVRCYNAALAHDPRFTLAHYNLATVLREKSEYAAAAAALARAVKLCAPDAPLLPGWKQELKSARRMAELAPRLSAYLKGEIRPSDNAERLDLAALCQNQRRFAPAARFYQEAFAADPRLAEDRAREHRYNASCAAARAGTDLGEGKVDETERAQWRQQAQAWLRAELTDTARSLESGKSEDRAAVTQALSYWQKDVDLAPVRDGEALAGLPTEERDAWKQLWADVAALLQRASGGK